MSRVIMIHQGQVKIVKSGVISIKRLQDEQHGIRYKLRINGQSPIIKSDIRILVQELENVKLAEIVVRAFTLMEVAEKRTLRSMFPGFYVTLSRTKHGGNRHESQTW